MIDEVITESEADRFPPAGGPLEGSAVLAALADPELAVLVSDELLCSAFTNAQGQRRALFANECRLLAMIEHRRLWRSEGHVSPCFARVNPGPTHRTKSHP